MHTHQALIAIQDYLKQEPNITDFHERQIKGIELADLRKLEKLGYVEQTDESARHIYFRLINKPIESKMNKLPASLFKLIVGYDDIKRMFTKALLSKEPVHILLVGAPASGKSLFMNEIEQLGIARYSLGSAIRNAGLTRFLIENRPEILIVDELDDMRLHELDVLHGLMSEQPIISEIKTGRNTELELKCKVFGSCNDTSRLPEKLLSRFIVLHLPNYTEEQFIEIIVNVLTKQEYKTQEIAEYIASQLIKALQRYEIRLAVKCARLCDTIAEVNSFIATIQRYS
jgi:Holliday junction DNA helicase RuvB